MTLRRALLLLPLLGACGDSGPTDITYPTIGSLAAPSGKGSFRFGAASAATQIEDGDINTDWYVWTQPTADGGLGKSAFVGDASMGYTHAIDDIQLMKDMHLDSYRFSIEWARVEPQRGVWDEAAFQHYSDELDALIAAGIRPLVSVHHWAFPIWIDDPRDPTCTNGPSDTNLCGLDGPAADQVVQEMAKFAGELAKRFGDRVDEWGTINEPVNWLVAAYGLGVFPPGQQHFFQLLDKFVPIVRTYLSAHAAMYKAIKQNDTIDADGDGRPADVGFTLSVADWEPANAHGISTHVEDTTARDTLIYVFHHLTVDAIEQGKFDANLDGTMDEDHPEWKGTADWLGLQYYFRAGVTGQVGLIPVLNLTPCFYGFDQGACLTPDDPTFCVPDMGYEFYPQGLTGVLEDFGKRYPDLPLIVSESGIATGEGKRRAEAVVRILEAIDRARAAGVDVRGYYHWSLYDNFEWSSGFVPRFGLYTVDYNTYARTATEGATVLGAIAGARKLTAAQRTQYGGDGPMTPEPNAPVQPYCYTPK